MTPFIGQINMFGFNFAPRGWAICQGQLIDIASHSAIFSLLGTTFGGDGRTTMGLPDFRGRMAVGVGNGPGLASMTWGEKGGNNYTALTASNLPPHHHGLSGLGIGYNEEGAGSGSTLTDLSFNEDDAEETLGVNKTVTDNTGAGTQFSNMPPFLAVYICIAMEGVYPSRS